MTQDTIISTIAAVEGYNAAKEISDNISLPPSSIFIRHYSDDGEKANELELFATDEYADRVAEILGEYKEYILTGVDSDLDQEDFEDEV
jgi:hypothetical protein